MALGCEVLVDLADEGGDGIHGGEYIPTGGGDRLREGHHHPEFSHLGIALKGRPVLKEGQGEHDIRPQIDAFVEFWPRIGVPR